MKRSRSFILALTAYVVFLAGCTAPSATPTSSSAPLSPLRARTTWPWPAASAVTAASVTSPSGGENGSLLLGNPSAAVAGLRADPDNRLVVRPQFALSYNRRQGGPNWVAWHLDSGDLGRVRRGSFQPDPLLPPDSQIRPTDYRGSGFDRGHLCPSGDRTNSRQNNDATFVMSNMLPQAAALNQHVWAKLEEYERAQARAGNELYILAGGAGSRGRIAGGRVNVPAVCWKILIVLPQGNNDLQRIDAGTRVIAVAMPNRERGAIEGSRWAQWITSVAQIEKTTGYKFFSTLPPALRQALQTKVDRGRASAAGSTDRTGSTDLINSTGGTDTFNDRRSSGVSPPSPRQAPPQESYRPPAADRMSIPDGRSAPDTQPAPGDSAAASGAAQVWVNTNSGIYHFPGTRWYGQTKEGAYMSESEAIGRGYRAARNEQ